MCFHAPLKPRKINKFLFLGTHAAFVTPKRIMVTPPLTTSFMNFIVSNRNTCPTETEFVTCAILLPSGQRFTSVERMIHSIRIDMRVQLHCIARICVVYLKEVDLLASIIVQSSSLPDEPSFSSVHRDKMWGSCQQFIAEEGTH